MNEAGPSATRELSDSDDSILESDDETAAGLGVFVPTIPADVPSLDVLSAEGEAALRLLTETSDDNAEPTPLTPSESDTDGEYS